MGTNDSQVRQSPVGSCCRGIFDCSRRALLSLGLAVAVLSAFPLLVSAGFDNPFWLSEAGDHDAESPRVAVSPDGNAVFVWSKDQPAGGIEARTRSVSGVLGPVLDVDPGQYAGAPRVGIVANGDAVLAWYNGGEILSRTLAADGALGPTFKVGDSNGTIHLAVDADGAVVFAWLQLEHEAAGFVLRVRARSLSADGMLGPIQDIDPAPAHGAESATVAIRAGRAAVVWTNYYKYGNAFDSQRVWARLRSPADVWGPIMVLSPDDGADAYAPGVALDSGGKAVVVWNRYGYDGLNPKVLARTVSAQGEAGPIHTVLSDVGVSYLSRGWFPQVRVDAAGNASFAFQRFDGTNWRVRTRTLSAAGVLNKSRDLSDIGYDSDSPTLAVGADGNAVFVWRKRSGRQSVVEACVRSADGAFRRIQVLSNAEKKVASPAVAVDQTGGAVAVWLRDSVNGWRTQAAIGP